MNLTPIEWCDFTANPIDGLCLHKCWYCVSEDTKILMWDLSIKQIKDIQIGDEIAGIKKYNQRSNAYKVEKSIVQNKFKTIKNAFKIELKDRSEFTCSADHRWFTNRGWKYVIGDQYGKNQRPYLTLNNSIRKIFDKFIYGQYSETKEYKKGYLAGIIKGDGLLKKYKDPRENRYFNYQFRLALKDKEPLKRTKRYLNDFDIDCFERKFGKNMEMIRNNRKNDFEKIIKLIKFNRNKEWYRGFISGFYDAEGGNNWKGKAIRIYNKDSNLLKLARNGLKTFGFKFVIEENKNNEVKTIRIRGGRDEFFRFVNIFNPSILRKRNIDKISLCYSSKVISIKNLNKKMKMYDLTTSTGNFIANNFIAHNCYEARRRKRFKLKDEITFRSNWFDKKQTESFIKKFNKPPKIFVGSTHDLFGDWIAKEWIEQIIQTTKDNPQAIFQFLTKNPKRYLKFRFPQNCWLGTTIESSVYDGGRLPFRHNEFIENYKFVSIEPLLGDFTDFDLSMFDLVIVGANSTPGAPPPKKEWIKSIKHPNIFFKNNIKKYL